MDIKDPMHLVADPSRAIAVRRFWIAWLVFLLAALAGIIVVILIAAAAADPVSVPPTG